MAEVNIYYPPKAGLVGSDPRDWFDQRIPANMQDAIAQVSKTRGQQLVNSLTMEPYRIAEKATTINITESAGFTKEWIWPVAIGIGLLLLYFSRDTDKGLDDEF